MNGNTTTTISRFRFTEDVGGAQQAATNGPVFITDRGQPALVLLSMEEYRRLTKTTLRDELPAFSR
jgi:PHD/YefM family antitoxin component YafN of YafNO toxin-antitoxin module